MYGSQYVFTHPQNNVPRGGIFNEALMIGPQKFAL